MATDPSSTRHGVRAVATTTTDPHRNVQRAWAARSAGGSLAVSVAALVIQAAAVSVPAWGYFAGPNPPPGVAPDAGYFGPWTQCKYLLYGREWCSKSVTRFQPVAAVWFAGLAAAGATSLLIIVLFLNVFQLAMASSANRFVISYSTALIGKVSLATLAFVLSILAASLFATQTDDRAHSFDVTRGPAFYLQVVAIFVNCILLIMSLYESFDVRRGNDPTRIRNTADPYSATINNPGYREYHQPTNGGNISMTDASGKPYVGGAGNGSTVSVATSGSVASTASPLRSSLKKPKPLGIHNPGFSAHSPTLSRNGSQKKVRIQTHSTEV